MVHESKGILLRLESDGRLVKGFDYRSSLRDFDLERTIAYDRRPFEVTSHCP